MPLAPRFGAGAALLDCTSRLTAAGQSSQHLCTALRELGIGGHAGRGRGGWAHGQTHSVSEQRHSAVAFWMLRYGSQRAARSAEGVRDDGAHKGRGKEHKSTAEIPSAQRERP